MNSPQHVVIRENEFLLSENDLFRQRPSNVASEIMDESGLGQTYENAFRIDVNVVVMPRTWPGINKPGGEGRIIKIHTNDDGTEVYDVKYILGGTDKAVPAGFVRLSNAELARRRVGGRCKWSWCPSFVCDCKHDQSIDPLILEEKTKRATKRAERKSRRNSLFNELVTMSQFQVMDDQSGCTPELSTSENITYADDSGADSEVSEESKHSAYIDEEDDWIDQCVLAEEVADDDESQNQLQVGVSKAKRRKLIVDDCDTNTVNTQHAVSNVITSSSSAKNATDHTTIRYSESSSASTSEMIAEIPRTVPVHSSSTRERARMLLNNITSCAWSEAWSEIGFIQNTVNSTVDSYGRSYDYYKQMARTSDILTGLELLSLLQDSMRGLKASTSEIVAKISALHERLSVLDDEDNNELNTQQGQSLAEGVLNLRDGLHTVLTVMVRTGKDIFYSVYRGLSEQRHQHPEMKMRFKRIKHSLDTITTACDDEDTRGKQALKRLERLFLDQFGETAEDFVVSSNLVESDDSDCDIYTQRRPRNPSTSLDKRRVRDRVNQSGQVIQTNSVNSISDNSHRVRDNMRIVADRGINQSAVHSESRSTNEKQHYAHSHKTSNAQQSVKRVRPSMSDDDETEEVRPKSRTSSSSSSNSNRRPQSHNCGESGNAARPESNSSVSRYKHSNKPFEISLSGNKNAQRLFKSNHNMSISTSPHITRKSVVKTATARQNDTDDELDILFGGDAPSLGRLRKKGDNGRERAAHSQRSKLMRRMFRSMHNSRGIGNSNSNTRDRGKFSALLDSDDRDTFGDDVQDKRTGVNVDGAESRSRFYKQIRFVPNISGTGRVVVFEGMGVPNSAVKNGRLSAEDVENYVSRYGPLTDSSGHSVTRDGNEDVSDRLCNLNLSSVNRNSQQLVDRVLNATNRGGGGLKNYDWLNEQNHQRIFVRNAEVHHMTQEGNNVLESVLANGLSILLRDGVETVNAEEVSATKDWAVPILVDLWTETRHLPKPTHNVLCRVFRDTIAPSVQEMRHLLMEFDTMVRLTTQGMEQLELSMAVSMSSKITRITVLLLELFLHSEFMFDDRRMSPDFIVEYLSHMDQLEMLLYSVDTSINTSHKYVKQLQSIRLKQSQVAIVAEDVAGDSVIETFARALNLQDTKRACLASYMRSTQDSIADDLWVHFITSLLINKIHALREAVSVLLKRLSTNGSLSPDELDIVRKCHAQFVTILTSVVETLLLNRRLLLTVLCFCAEAAGSAELSACLSFHTNAHASFVPGVEGRTTVFIRLLFSALDSLDWMQVNCTFEDECVNYNPWNVINCAVASVCGLTSLNISYASHEYAKSVVHVNPTVQVISNDTTPSTQHLRDTSLVSSESVWGVITLTTLMLHRIEHRRLMKNGVRVISSKLKSENWSLVSGICRAIGDNESNALDTTVKYLSRSTRLTSLWANPSECVHIYLRAVHRALPSIERLVIRVEDDTASLDDVSQMLRERSLATTRRHPQMDDSTAILLCAQSYFGAVQQSNGLSDESSTDYFRVQLHEQLLTVVTLLFGSHNLVSPYDKYFHKSTQHAVNKASSTTEATSSLASIDALRSIFQDLLCTSVTHRNVVVDDVSGSVSEISDKTAELVETVALQQQLSSPSVFTTIFDVFSSKPCFVTGLLLCLLVKEISAVCGLDFVTTEHATLGISYRSCLINCITSSSLFHKVSEGTIDLKPSLMWFAALITFNPLPVAVVDSPNSDSDDLEVRVQTLLRVQDKDIATLDVCCHLAALMSEEQHADYSSKLTAGATLCSLFKYISKAINCRMKVKDVANGESVSLYISTLPMTLLQMSSDVVRAMLRGQRITRGLMIVGSYLYCLIMHYLREWLTKSEETVRFCQVQLQRNLFGDMVSGYQLICSHIRTQYTALLSLLSRICEISVFIRPNLMIMDTPESFSFAPHVDLFKYMDDTGGQFIEMSTSHNSKSICNSVSTAALCHSVVVAFSNVVYLLQTASHMHTVLGLTPNENNIEVLVSPVKFHRDIVMFLKPPKNANDHQMRETNVHCSLSTLYWQALLSQTCREQTAFSSQMLPYILCHEVDLYVLLIMNCFLCSINTTVSTQIIFRSFFQSMLQVSRDIVNNKDCLVQLATTFNTTPGHSTVKPACSSLYRLANVFLNVYKLLFSGAVIETLSHDQFILCAETMLRELSYTFDYSEFETTIREQKQGMLGLANIRPVIAAEERTSTVELVGQCMRLLRYLEVCAFHRISVKSISNIARISAKIKQCISFMAVNSVNCSAIGKNPIGVMPLTETPIQHQSVFNLEECKAFFAEFVLQDVRALLKDTNEKNNGNTTLCDEVEVSVKCRPLLGNIYQYTRMAVCLPSNIRGVEVFQPLLHLLLMLNSSNVSQVSSVNEYLILYDEVTFLWSLSLTLTPVILSKFVGYNAMGEPLGALTELLASYLSRDKYKLDGVSKHALSHITAQVEIDKARLPNYSSGVCDAVAMRMSGMHDYLMKNEAWEKSVSTISSTFSTNDSYESDKPAVSVIKTGGMPIQQSMKVKYDSLLVNGVDWQLCKEKLRICCDGLRQVFNDLIVAMDELW